MLCLDILYHLSNESTKNRQMVNREELKIVISMFHLKKNVYEYLPYQSLQSSYGCLN